MQKPHTELVKKFYQLLSENRIPEWLELWHDDGKIIVPYPAKGFAPLIDGKDAIRTTFNGLFDNFERFDSNITGIYDDPDTNAVCVEYKNDAMLKNGTPYTNDNIAVFIFRDGLISEYHDYFDPRRFQTVVDAL
ncbi:MAG TPA: nuclear transport factor 2 family protein [Candidatus Saccharimonas sp.]|nr:nuclear transport factor 2 family protein [Candidatus Saccharimonas sp.]